MLSASQFHKPTKAVRITKNKVSNITEKLDQLTIYAIIRCLLPAPEEFTSGIPKRLTRNATTGRLDFGNADELSTGVHESTTQNSREVE